MMINYQSYFAKRRSRLKNAAVWITLLAVVASQQNLRGADWPTYMHDNARSGVTAEVFDPAQMTEPLWVYTSPAPPQMAWPGPPPFDAGHRRAALAATRDFDAAFYTTAAGKAVFFGSSVTDGVYCLDGATGQQRWYYRTDGPVRFAPSYSAGKVFFGSDDGYVYCVGADSGKLVWKYRAGDEERLVGHDGSLVPFWPVRTNVAVDGEKVYFSASLVPWRTPYLCALDAATGADTGAGLYKQEARAPGMESTYKGSILTPMGATLLSQTKVYLMQGRIAPQVFDRATGKHLGMLGVPGEGWAANMSVWAGGGTYALLTPDERLIHGRGGLWKTGDTLNEFKADGSRDFVARHPSATCMVIAGGRSYTISTVNEIKEQGLIILSQTTLSAVNRNGGKKLWQVESDCPYTLIMAGGVLLAGGDEKIVAYHSEDGRELWRQEVTGRVRGLTFANGRLLVSTDTGHVYAFGEMAGP